MVKARLIIICVLFLLPFATINAQTMRGKASYYANEFVGQRTASGEVFTLNELTCAHRTLPFGTMLKVKNLDNGSEVVVRVNDRGPFIPGRIIDLSYAAAKKLGIIIKGLCNAEISFYNEEEESEGEIDAPLALMVDVIPQDIYPISSYQNRQEFRPILLFPT